MIIVVSKGNNNVGLRLSLVAVGLFGYICGASIASGVNKSGSTTSTRGIDEEKTWIVMRSGGSQVERGR